MKGVYVRVCVCVCVCVCVKFCDVMFVYLHVLGPENMYIYEGRDYSRANDNDRKTFDELLAGTRTC